MNEITVDEAYETRSKVFLKWKNPCTICRPFRINELDREDFTEYMDGSVSFRGFEVHLYKDSVTISFNEEILYLDQGIQAIAPKWCYESKAEVPTAYELPILEQKDKQ